MNSPCSFSSSPNGVPQDTSWVIDARRLTIFLADATRYARLLFILALGRYRVFTESLEVGFVLVIGDLQNERVLVFLLTLALGADRTAVAGDAVLVQLLQGLIEVFVLGALRPTVVVR